MCTIISMSCSYLWFLALIFALSSTTSAFPSPSLSGTKRQMMSSRQSKDTMSKTGSILYLVLALIGIGISASCLVTRAVLTKKYFSGARLSVIHWLVFAIYGLGLLYFFAATILYFGLGLIGKTECHTAILICLVFYLGQKVTLYIFLVERTHTVRTTKMHRRKDWIYLYGLGLVIIGFSAIAVSTFVYSISEYDSTEGICRIGLPYDVSTALLTFDIFVNFFLTTVFLYYLRPHLTEGMLSTFLPVRMRRINSSAPMHSGLDLNERSSFPQLLLEHLIRKTFWGCLCILISTVANLTILLIFQGHEQGWMYFTFCTLDVIWAICVIHWLTNSPEEMRSKHELGLENTSNTTTTSRPRFELNSVNRRDSDSLHDLSPHLKCEIDPNRRVDSENRTTILIEDSTYATSKDTGDLEIRQDVETT